MQKKPSLFWRIMKYLAIAVVGVLAISVIFFRPTFDYIMTSFVELVTYYGGGFLSLVTNFIIANWLPGLIFGAIGFTFAGLIFKGYLKTIKFGTKQSRELAGLQMEPRVEIIGTSETPAAEIKKEE